MSKSIKAVLLSALVFPGSGHFYLKKPVQGTLLLGITLFFLYSLISKVFEIAQNLSAKIQSGEVSMDITDINELVTQQLNGSESQFTNLPISIILICWVVGIADSYRIGRIQDKIDNEERKNT